MTTIKAHFQLDYGDFKLDVDLKLPGTGITVLFGHSGSGKTTLLRCIAGLQHAPQGFLEINGHVWQDSERGLFLPTHKRPLGYVFQEANLFPHLTVRDNLHYGLKRTKQNSGTVKLEQAVELLGIAHLMERMPEHLSGGERQRVAIARALALNPEILLMDEPLASLDFKRKQEILPFLSRLHQQLDIPVLYVTHSQQEVAQLADTLVIMEDGRALASGPLSETQSRLDVPLAQDREAATVWQATVAEHEADYHLTRVAFAGGSLSLPAVDARSARHYGCRFTPAMSASPLKRQPPPAFSMCCPQPSPASPMAATDRAWCGCRSAIRRCWRTSPANRHCCWVCRLAWRFMCRSRVHRY